MSRFSILSGVPQSSSSGESSQQEEHVFRLSTIDQASERTYLRYCVGFPCNSGDIDTVPERLTYAVKRTVEHLPMLAGWLRPVDGDSSGRLEIVLSASHIASFKPVIKIIPLAEFRYSFQELANAGVPPSVLVNHHLTPLGDAPTTPAPVFAVQASFIAGGVIVAIYVHHAISDVFGLQTILRHLSSDLPAINLTDDAIHEETADESKLRDRLSGSRGFKAAPASRFSTKTTNGPSPNAFTTSIPDPSHDCIRVLSFNLDLVEGAHGMVHERLRYMDSNNHTHLSTFQVLSAILWKGINRALSQHNPIVDYTGWTPVSSSLAIPINIRTRIVSALDTSYLGNATYHHIAQEDAHMLALPYNITRLRETACLIDAGMRRVDEESVRTAISSINESSNVQESPAKAIMGCDNTFKIVDQTHIRLEGAHLNLGLGSPHWARKIGQEVKGGQFITHPIVRDSGVWEVEVELSGKCMEALLTDNQFMVYVSRVA